ncbi:hypothetical protein SAY87_020442 [Trapa incisa]|uniref:Uncharacterized protein n=1 Tax=Trapa incisa TaxID=236973 RepID=A0AAN7K6Q9_9MYRT|nr:hypothetical protein SAY87_020442 [Trapa incisa]
MIPSIHPGCRQISLQGFTAYFILRELLGGDVSARLSSLTLTYFIIKPTLDHIWIFVVVINIVWICPEDEEKEAFGNKKWNEKEISQQLNEIPGSYHIMEVSFPL